MLALYSMWCTSKLMHRIWREIFMNGCEKKATIGIKRYWSNPAQSTTIYQSRSKAASYVQSSEQAKKHINVNIHVYGLMHTWILNASKFPLSALRIEPSSSLGFLSLKSKCSHRSMKVKLSALVGNYDMTKRPTNQPTTDWNGLITDKKDQATKREGERDWVAN